MHKIKETAQADGRKTVTYFFDEEEFSHATYLRLSANPFHMMSFGEHLKQRVLQAENRKSCSQLAISFGQRTLTCRLGKK